MQMHIQCVFFYTLIVLYVEQLLCLLEKVNLPNVPNEEFVPISVMGNKQ